MKGKHHISATRVMPLMIQIFLRYALSRLFFSKLPCSFRMIRSCDFIDGGKFALKLMVNDGPVEQLQLGGPDLCQALNAVQESSTGAVLLPLFFLAESYLCSDCTESGDATNK